MHNTALLLYVGLPAMATAAAVQQQEAGVQEPAQAAA